MQRPYRLLFCSYHCYFDPSNGASLATRDLLELLAQRGWDCRVFCGPQLDFEDGKSVAALLQERGVGFAPHQGVLETTPVSLFQFKPAGVPVTVYAPATAGGQAPGPGEGAAFLALFDRALEDFRPDVLLTYGSQWVAREYMARASRRGAAVVFALHNVLYDDAALFDPVDAVLVPSHFLGEHYRRRLGLACTVIPGPVSWSRVQCPVIYRRYVTFVNPQPDKGVFLFARIAEELAARRPDIPVLVVEGRGTAAWLGHTGVDFGALGTVSVMANTSDPREFYRVTRLLLLPSLCNESFARVAAEAMMNGIPVLASDRGALPETLEQAGFLFSVPDRYTPETRLLPSAGEVGPWVQTISRLWDDVALYAAECQRARRAAEAWHPERLGARYEEFLAGVVRKPPL